MIDSGVNTDTLGPHCKPWLLPVLFAQAQVLRFRIRRLPEPPGERAGAVAGCGPPWRVLVLGDSAAVAVGVSRQSQGLAPQLATTLAETTSRSVIWQALGRSGLKAADCERDQAVLFSTLPDAARFDLIVTSLGTNDAIGLTGSAAFTAPMRHLAVTLSERLTEHGRVLFGRAPPLACSSIFSGPLRRLIDWRVVRINQLLAEVAGEFTQVTMAQEPLALAPADFAEDGFHPNATSYGVWGRHLAECFLREQLVFHPPASVLSRQ